MKAAPNQVGWVLTVGELYYGFYPISLDDSKATLLERPLVNRSTKFFSNFTKFRITILLNRRLTDLIWICLFIFLLAFSCFRISMTDLESIWTEIENISLGTIENLDKRSFNHSASEQVVFKVMSSGSMVLWTITIFFAGFQYSSTTEYEYISGSRFNTVGISDPFGITINLHNIRISNVSQTISNYASKISENSL